MRRALIRNPENIVKIEKAAENVSAAFSYYIEVYQQLVSQTVRFPSETGCLICFASLSLS
ncbi:hypothetical protein GCM10010918_00400 [Paenibacillus radicis (ex Gao et al. 2016)]|uniref:Uncharacterized protein n=1 Tax=Paenibacillus radicis (ex Gao et al. 2016) TaxID=1737354 RepID=A0A917GN98_9BACL|nr:hypothetical protein GCM10010918_00400 [Paenibacillus radicis (ex Gao et al. 2016)]